MNVRVLAVVAGLLAIGLVLWLWPKAEQSPEDRIRALVAQVVSAAEARDVGAIADTLSPAFKGPSGVGRDETRSLLLGYLVRNREVVTVLNPTLDVTLASETQAHFSGRFVFAGQQAKTIDELPQGAELSAYEIEGELERIDGEWRFTSAKARQLGR